MQRDTRAYLWDAREAADAIIRFTQDRTRQEFEEDLLLRSAVERQFQIIGEALGQLSRYDPTVAERIPYLARIVAFRNILVHSYAVIDNEMVWRIVQESLPQLRSVLDLLLRDAPPAGDPP